MTVPAADGTDVAATNPVNVLRDYMWARYAQGSGWFCRWCGVDKSIHSNESCQFGSALASVERLVEAARGVVDTWGHLRSHNEARHELRRALARFPKHEEPA